MTLVVSASILVFACMIAEARVAGRHERVQRAAGAVEAVGDVYRIMRFAYPAAFLLVLAEGAVRATRLDAVATAGAVVFVWAKALKYWAIAALGDRWTFRVIVAPGRPLVTTGPYRYLRHPNYVAVVGELIGTALAMHAPIAGAIAAAGFGGLMLRRIAIEERALAGGSSA